MPKDKELEQIDKVLAQMDESLKLALESEKQKRDKEDRVEQLKKERAALENKKKTLETEISKIDKKIELEQCSKEESREIRKKKIEQMMEERGFLRVKREFLATGNKDIYGTYNLKELGAVLADLATQITQEEYILAFKMLKSINVRDIETPPLSCYDYSNFHYNPYLKKVTSLSSYTYVFELPDEVKVVNLCRQYAYITKKTDDSINEEPIVLGRYPYISDNERLIAISGYPKFCDNKLILFDSQYCGAKEYFEYHRLGYHTTEFHMTYTTYLPTYVNLGHFYGEKFCCDSYTHMRYLADFIEFVSNYRLENKIEKISFEELQKLEQEFIDKNKEKYLGKARKKIKKPSIH